MTYYECIKWDGTFGTTQFGQKRFDDKCSFIVDWTIATLHSTGWIDN